MSCFCPTSEEFSFIVWAQAQQAPEAATTIFSLLSLRGSTSFEKGKTTGTQGQLCKARLTNDKDINIWNFGFALEEHGQFFLSVSAELNCKLWNGPKYFLFCLVWNKSQIFAVLV